MLFFKFNLLLLTILFSSSNFADSFSDRDCFDSEFDVIVSHKVKPFGMFQNVIKFSKNRCVLTIEASRYKFMKDRWIIDICREPIHIKSGTGAIDVSKKINYCGGENSSKPYCRHLKDLLERVEDDGLIFAEGERESLESDHGKYFCGSLLLKAYLEQGNIFSHNAKIKAILNNPTRRSEYSDTVEASIPEIEIEKKDVIQVEPIVEKNKVDKEEFLNDTGVEKSNSNTETFDKKAFIEGSL